MGGIEVGIFREGEELGYCIVILSLIRTLRQEMREGDNLPKSFPKPDSLNPPNGAATSVLL